MGFAHSQESGVLEVNKGTEFFQLFCVDSVDMKESKNLHNEALNVAWESIGCSLYCVVHYVHHASYSNEVIGGSLV